MKVTEYGQKLANDTQDAAALAARVGEATGATAHMLACETDTGLVVKLTGQDFRGRRISRHARSVAAAWFTMKAVAGLNNAWHILPDGTRRLLIVR